MSETRKLAAILVADIVGYSRLAGADEERTLARVRGLRSDLLEPTIAAHRGRVVKRTGDGSIVEFRSVVDAVRCAIEVQTGLIERNAGVPPERRIEYRVGVHLGDVVEESDGDLMGDGVNIAARLEGVAKPGAICLSEQAYWQVKGRLDLKVTDLGATQLKNIAEPIRIYSLEVGQQAQAGPMPWAAPAPPAPPAALADQQAAIKRIRAKRGFERHAIIYVAVNLLLIAIWALTGPGYANHRHEAESDFWPIWPILGWGVGLGVHYWAVFHQKPISDDEIRREMEKGS
jgi:class 3 adenylate cyclase